MSFFPVLMDGVLRVAGQEPQTPSCEKVRCSSVTSCARERASAWSQEIDIIMSRTTGHHYHQGGPALQIITILPHSPPSPAQNMSPTSSGDGSASGPSDHQKIFHIQSKYDEKRPDGEAQCPCQTGQLSGCETPLTVPHNNPCQISHVRHSF